MKTITKIAFAVLAILFVFTACSKNDDSKPVVYPEENPWRKYYEATGFTAIDSYINAYPNEAGLVFSPKVKGKINALTVKIPDINNQLRITIWDYETQAILRSEIVNIATQNTEFTIPILPMELVKDKKYLISMNTRDWYERGRVDLNDAPYPITAGNIIFYEFRWENGATAQNFPTRIANNLYQGDLRFVFQQVD
jgi:hypothetical protein